MRSIVSIQVLSGIICFCCASYLILTIYYPYSIQTFIGQMRLGFQLTQIQAKGLVPNKSVALTGKANSSTESYICDAEKGNSTHNQTSSVSFEIHRFTALRRSY